LVGINLVEVCSSLEAEVARVEGLVVVQGEVQDALLLAAWFGMVVGVLERNLAVYFPKLLKVWLQTEFQTIWAGLCC
jgi:hypothetical protein